MAKKKGAKKPKAPKAAKKTAVKPIKVKDFPTYRLDMGEALPPQGPPNK
jgi:hypothetical protein